MAEDTMKVVYLVPRLNNAGPINQMYNLIANIDRSRYRLYIVTMYYELENSRKNEFEELGIPIKCLKLKYKYFNISDVHRLNKLIKQVQPDIVHSETLPADILVSKINRKFKWCTTIHCNIYNDYQLRFSNNVAKLMIYFHNNCLKKVDKLISCSNTLEKIYSQQGLENIAIQNGVDVSKYHMDNERIYWRNKLNLPQNKKIIIVVGSIDYRKRSLFIIKAIKDYIREKAIKLIFCGEGKDIEKCKEEAKGYDIEFRGQIEDMVPYLNAVDLYLSASSSEGLPMSVIEAGCCGLPMVLSNIEQHKEIINTGKDIRGVKFALLDNEQSFLDAIKEIVCIKVDKKEIADYFQDTFSGVAMANKYENVYWNMGKEES